MGILGLLLAYCEPDTSWPGGKRAQLDRAEGLELKLAWADCDFKVVAKIFLTGM